MDSTESSQGNHDTAYLPPGAEPAEYEIRTPDGANFQGTRIDPPFWWTEMAYDTLQLLIYDRDISGYNASAAAAGIEVLTTEALENPNYLFVTLDISNARPGRFPIVLRDDQGAPARTYMYELKPRQFK